jgi:hypothetical protein
MADGTKQVSGLDSSNGLTAFPMRLRDMGDGTWAIVAVAQGVVGSGSADSGNPVKIGGKYNATLPTLVDGQRGDAQLDSFGNLRVLGAVKGVTGTNNVSNTIGEMLDLNSPFNQRLLGVAPHRFNGTGWDMDVKSNSTSRLLSSAATTNATSVKASAGTVRKIICNNTVASDRFLKFYNKASAPTVGTDTPILTLTLPASTKNIQLPLDDHYFSTGIAFAITGAAADADTTAIAAGDITALNITYA